MAVLAVEVLVFLAAGFIHESTVASPSRFVNLAMMRVVIRFFVGSYRILSSSQMHAVFIRSCSVILDRIATSNEPLLDFLELLVNVLLTTGRENLR